MTKREKLKAMSEEDDERQPLLEEGNVQERSGGLLRLNNCLPREKTSPLGAIFIIINAALGAGLLAFPLAFYRAGGIGEGLGVMMFLLVWISLGLVVLAYLAETLQASTYEEVIGRACGKVVKVVVDFCIIIYTFGTSITFLVVIGDQLQDLSTAVHLHGNSIQGDWWVNRKLLISVSSLLFILPWLWMKRIGVLSYSSALGVVCCVYICLVVLVRYFIPYSSSDITCQQTSPISDCPTQWTDFFTAIPFICFGFQCHVSSVPIYSGLKRRSVRAYLPIVSVALVVCFLVYSLTGVFGFLTYHQHCCINSDILRNYYPQDPIVDVARVTLILVMITSYPILAFCGRTALDYRVKQVLSYVMEEPRYQWWDRVRLGTEGTIWLLLSVLLALFVPQISTVISPIGGLAAILMFVFPAMGWLHLTFQQRRLHCLSSSCVITACSVLLVLGSFIFGTSVVYNIMLDFHLLS